MSGGVIKVNLNFNDSGTVFPGGNIVGNAGMQIYNPMGDNWDGLLVLEESSAVLSPTAYWLIVSNSGTYNYNASGMWVLIKNAGSTGGVAIEMSLTSAERSGSDYEWVTIGKFRGAENAQQVPNEFMWLYLGGPNDIDGTNPRGLRVRNTGGSEVQVTYSLISAGNNL